MSTLLTLLLCSCRGDSLPHSAESTFCLVLWCVSPTYYALICAVKHIKLRIKQMRLSYFQKRPRILFLWRPLVKERQRQASSTDYKRHFNNFLFFLFTHTSHKSPLNVTNTNEHARTQLTNTKAIRHTNLHTDSKQPIPKCTPFYFLLNTYSVKLLYLSMYI